MIKDRLAQKINALNNEAITTRKKLVELATKGSLTEAFSQIKFSDAAAAETALAAMKHSPDFVNNKIEGNSLSDYSDDEIQKSCEDILRTINRQIQSTVSLSMDTTKINAINGLNRANEAMSDVLGISTY